MGDDQIIAHWRFPYREGEHRPEFCSVPDIAFRGEACAQTFGGELDAGLAASGQKRDRRLDMVLLK